MSKTLVAYFSAEGNTKVLAKTISDVVKGDIFEIAPTEKYTSADLNWQNKSSRSSIEMQDKASRPTIADKVENMDQYDTVFVGFPIWWYIAPTIINTFLESYDFAGKTIVPFATSGGSGFGNTVKELQPSAPNTEIVEGKILNSKSEIEKFAKSL